MESDSSAPGGPRKLPFEAQQLKSLVDLMVTNDLSRIELRDGSVYILLRRGQPVVAQAAPVTAGTAPPVAAAGPTPTGTPPPPSTMAEDELMVRSPMVGTFYSAPGPDAPPFVNVGSVVKPGSVICMVEAMKVFNEIKADVAGRVTKILARNAQAIEYDQPLFAVAPL